MPSVPTPEQRRRFRKTPSPKHKAFLRTVPLMGEVTLATIEIIAVEERSAPIQPNKKFACSALSSSDFLFARHKPSRVAHVGKQKIRVFSSQMSKSSAIAAVVASRHLRDLSPDKALVYVKEFGIEDGSAATVEAKKALVSTALEKLYANWCGVERVIIYTDSRLFSEIVSRIFMRMFSGKSLPKEIRDKLSGKSIRALIDVKTVRVKISRR